MEAGYIISIIVVVAYCLISIFLTVFGAITDNSGMLASGSTMLGIAFGSIINKFVGNTASNILAKINSLGKKDN